MDVQFKKGRAVRRGVRRVRLEGVRRAVYNMSVKLQSKGGSQKGTLRSAIYTLAVILMSLWILFLIFEVAWIIITNYGKARSSGELAALVSPV